MQCGGSSCERRWTISAKSFRPAADLVWDAKGNNTAAVIFLNAVKGDHFKEIAEVSREDLTK